MLEKYCQVVVLASQNQSKSLCPIHHFLLNALDKFPGIFDKFKVYNRKLSILSFQPALIKSFLQLILLNPGKLPLFFEQSFGGVVQKLSEEDFVSLMPEISRLLRRDTEVDLHLVISYSISYFYRDSVAYLLE